MCYSGRCHWEGHMGDCNFPTHKAVREKYPLPVCGIDVQSEEEQEYVNDVIEDIKNILDEIKRQI